MNEPYKPTIEVAMAAITTLQDATSLSFTRVDTEINALRTDMNNGFALVNKRFDLMDSRFDVMEKRFDRLEQRFDGLEQLIIASKPKPKRTRPQDRE